MHAHVILHFNFERENKFKALLFTCIALPITIADQLEMGVIHISIITIIPSTTCSISECIPNSNKICSLISYLKKSGDLVWCMLGHILTLCKRIITRKLQLWQTIVVTWRQAVHQSNVAGSQILPSLDFSIHYYTLHYWSVCITNMHAYINCWCLHWLAS